MPELIRLVHNSSMGIKKLVKMFRVHWGAKQPHPPIIPSEQLPSMCSPKALPPCGINHKLATPSSEEYYASVCNMSKRQLESKIVTIATKEVRSQKAMWYVHQEILQQYGLSDAIIPLEVLGLSAVDKSVDHSCRGRRGIKRSGSHPPVKTLQHFFQTSPASHPQQKTMSSTIGGGIQPSDSSCDPVKTSQFFLPLPLASPQSDKEIPLSTYNQVARKLVLSSETHLPKRARLDDASPFSNNNAPSLIVLDSDDSQSNSTELDVTETVASRMDKPMEVDRPQETHAVLEERTNIPCNAPPTDTSGLARVDCQNQWVENSRLEVSVDVHL